MNCETEFQNWIQNIYADQQAKFLINGSSTEKIKITKRTWQSCPMLPLIFILAMKILAIKIKHDTRIAGMKENIEEYKMKSYGDDALYQ